jgi:hypothetical protein
VSIRFSTGCPFKCATIVLTATYPMLTGSCTTSRRCRRRAAP